MILKDKYSLSAHISRFDTEKKCHDYLIQVRWNGRPQCPDCGNNHLNYYLTSRNVYKCSKCYKQFSITQGTIFHRSKLPLTTWFLAIYFFTTKKRGVSSIQMGKWLGVKQHTAWYIMHRLREAISKENDTILGGIIEGDETFVGPKINRDKRLQAAKWKHDNEQIRLHGYTESQRAALGIKKKRGRKKGETNEVLRQRRLENGGKKTYDKNANHVPFEKGTIVLGMIEREGKIVMKKLGTNIRSINKNNIFPHLKKHISSDSIFLTDEHGVYKGTDKLFAEHQTVNHNKGYVINEIHINNIENAWNHLKRMIDGTYFHLSYHHFDGYLNEVSYRWNRKNESERVIFENFIPMIIGRKITYKELKDRKETKKAA